ncbi:MAG: HlyD family efflux transporter periplasmic adaptor subunit [Desulfobacteraceae bacterium]|nr:HlyD family efflux transporter periplasmic adaptor subunit [Desulfobacteraceae bacterium]
MSKISGKTTAAVLLIAGTVFLAILAAHFIHHRLAYAVTDAVFVRTDSLTTVGFDQVGGRIVTMRKNEGDAVKAGEELAAIECRTYDLQVDRRAAELAAARQDLESKKLALERLTAEVPLTEQIARDEAEQLRKEEEAFKARAAAVQADIDRLARDRDRYAALFQAKAVARQKAEDAATALAASQAQKRAIEKQAAAVHASLASAGKKVQLARTGRLRIEETRRDIQAGEENVKALAARLNEARNTRAKSVLYSPIAGRVAKRFASPGDVIASPKAVYALVDPRDIYVVALLEENKLEGVRPGAPATITIDAYPDQPYRGVVKDVLPTSAATFALAPRDISAGEFTKVAQRIPVRIAITSGDLSLLRVGMGGEVEIKRISGQP